MMMCLEQGESMAKKSVVCVKIIGSVEATSPCYPNGEPEACVWKEQGFIRALVLKAVCR